MKTKKTTLLILISFFLFTLYSQPNENYRIVANSYEKIKLTLTSNPLQYNDIQTEKGVFSRLTMDNFFASTSVGNPELPTLVKMIEIPICMGIQTKIINKDSTIISLSELAIHHAIYPAQPSYSKSQEGPFPLVINEHLYSQNSFYGDELIKVEKIGVARNINLGTLYYSPIRYNPVTQEVIIYNRVEVEITFYRPDIATTNRMKELHPTPLFNISSQVINPIDRQRDHLLNAPIKYLIVAHSSFRGQFDAFIAWKKRKGFLVEIAYTDDANVGTTTTSIANFIYSHYTNATADNPAPLYVLLVGDVQQIPAFSGRAGSHVTDLYYFTWTTGDNIPDCYYGRFSAQNLTQLTPQIEKTLMYEQYAMSDPSYLDKAVAIAGVDRGSAGDFGYTHANPTIHYLTNEYLNTSYGYTTVNAFYNPQASTSTSVIANLLKSGVGYANYTAHCNSTLWGSPQFSTSDIAAMTNVEKMGLMIGNCCLSNKFDDSECFGEALLRKGNYSGAVGYIGGSNSTYWDEDYYWAVGLRNIGSNGTVPSYDQNNLGAYDRFFHTHNEPFADWYVTNGAMITAGNMAVQSSTSSLKLYYWEIYHLMGDPSVMTWFTQPLNMQVTANNSMFLGVSSLQIQAVPYAYVALTDPSTNLIAAGFADASGNITLSFNPLSTPGQYELVASAQHYQTYFQTIQVIVPAGPYVIVDSLMLSQGSFPNEGSMVNWDIAIRNVGVSNATNIRVMMTENSPYLSLIDSQDSLSLLQVGQHQILPISFTGQIANHVPDQTEITLTVTVYYDVNQSNVFNFSLIVNSPNLVRVRYSTTEISGNGDANVDPGETYKLEITNQNNGNLSISNIISELQTYYPLVTITPASTTIGTISKGNDVLSAFSIQIDNAVPDGTLIPFFHRIYNSNHQLLDTFYIFVGKAMEDFETNNFNSFPWEHSANPWFITTSNVFEGRYSARSKQSLGNNQSSFLSITWTSTVDDSLTFYRKVSSEAGYDGLIFYIDSAAVESFSGNMNWSRGSYPISAGTHSFIFRYVKDQYQIGGSDCAWIDFIKFPVAGHIPSNENAMADLVFTDAQLQANVSPDCGASLHFDITLENQGNGTANQVWCEVQSLSPYVVIYNSSDNTIGNVNAGATYNFIPNFSVALEEYIPDQTTIPFLFIVHYDNGATDSMSLQITANAPLFDLVQYDLTEIQGNGDDDFNPGETFQLRFIHANIGSAKIENVNSRLSSNDTLASIHNPQQLIPIMNVGNNDTTAFTVSFSPNTPDGTVITLNHDLTKGQYHISTPVIVNIVTTPSSIELLNANNEMKVYPNPTEQWLTIETTEKLTKVQIFDITGKILLEYHSLNDDKINLNLASISSGIYLLKAYNSENRTLYSKFIKQN